MRLVSKDMLTNAQYSRSLYGKALQERMQKGLPKREAIQGVDKIIAVASGKGGVGKSTVSVNLAAGFSRLGLKTGLLDADIHGPSIPKMLHLTRPDNLTLSGEKLDPVEAQGIKVMSMGLLVSEDSPIVWRGLMIMKGLEQLIRDVLWSPLDILVIDLPPGTGDAQLTVTQLLPIDGAVVVTTPQDVAVIDVKKAVMMFQKLQIPILGVIKNMDGFICTHCKRQTQIYKIGPSDTFNQLMQKNSLELLEKFPIIESISAGSDEGTPIILKEPGSVPGIKFANVCKKLAVKLDKGYNF